MPCVWLVRACNIQVSQAVHLCLAGQRRPESLGLPSPPFHPPPPGGLADPTAASVGQYVRHGGGEGIGGSLFTYCFSCGTSFPLCARGTRHSLHTHTHTHTHKWQCKMAIIIKERQTFCPLEPITPLGPFLPASPGSPLDPAEPLLPERPLAPCSGGLATCPAP